MNILFPTPNPQIPTLPHFSPLKHNRFAIKNQKPFSGERNFLLNQTDRYPKNISPQKKAIQSESCPLHGFSSINAFAVLIRRTKRLSEKYKDNV